MKPPIQTIRLSKQEADILNSVKRRTKINQWNTLCRMGFCISCQDPAEPANPISQSVDSGVELDWPTFGGQDQELYAALNFIHKLKTGSKLSDSEYFKRLLSRGIIRLKEQV